MWIDVLLWKSQVKLVNIRNDDIADGNPKLTLGLIWTIILHFQVSFSVSVKFPYHLPPPPPPGLQISLTNHLNLGQSPVHLGHNYFTPSNQTSSGSIIFCFKPVSASSNKINFSCFIIYPIWSHHNSFSMRKWRFVNESVQCLGQHEELKVSDLI